MEEILFFVWSYDYTTIKNSFNKKINRWGKNSHELWDWLLK